MKYFSFGSCKLFCSREQFQKQVILKQTNLKPIQCSTLQSSKTNAMSVNLIMLFFLKILTAVLCKRNLFIIWTIKHD